MKSLVLSLTTAADPGVALGPLSEIPRQPSPDFALAFLPPSDRLEELLAGIVERWPEAMLVGCEAVTQFADDRLDQGGSLLLGWLEAEGSEVWAEVIAGTVEHPPAAEVSDALARRLDSSDAAFLIVDGLRFPAQTFLQDLRRRFASPPIHLVGGLASQAQPIEGPGARVFYGSSVQSAACLAVGFRGVAMVTEIVRGWDAASPVYTVTRAEGNTLFAIDGEPATDWYRRFFTLDGELTPMPESTYAFPLILEGPDPDRVGLYRSMQSFGDPPGAVTFWGDVVAGDRVRLGIGNDLSLERAASRLTSSLPGPEAAVLYSCVGRELVLGAQADREVAAIRSTLGGAPLTGFFTFGEIGPTPRGALAFYNQTAILALLREQAT